MGRSHSPILGECSTLMLASGQLRTACDPRAAERAVQLSAKDGGRASYCKSTLSVPLLWQPVKRDAGNRLRTYLFRRRQTFTHACGTFAAILRGDACAWRVDLRPPAVARSRARSPMKSIVSRANVFYAHTSRRAHVERGEGLKH